MFASRIIDLFNSQAQALQTDPHRNGPLLHLPGKGDLILVGDLHNHRRNYDRVKTYAQLDTHPNRMVILQELIHGGALGPNGEDTSFELLIDALHWSQKHPGQIHFLLANHDLAQIQQIPVMKDGYDLTDRFNRYLTVTYPSRVGEMTAAFRGFILSQALAAISVTGYFFSHSLPGPRDLIGFDPSVLRRPLVEADLLRGGSAHKMIWGRHRTPDVLQTLAKLWWADAFICGHQQQEAGFGMLPPNMIIVDSSHNHGVLLHLDLARPYALADLEKAVILLASLP